VKLVLAISAVILVLVLIYFRLDSETGPMALERCKVAVSQARSWTVESTQSYEAVNTTTRSKISCPDDFEFDNRSRTPDNVIKEQSTIYTGGIAYVENADGNWAKSAPAKAYDPPTVKECGKGPALFQNTVLNAILELPHRRAGSIVKGQLQITDGVKCQEWHVEYGNEWPQTAPFTVCIDRKTHLPRRITFSESSGTEEFTGWNTTTVEPPAL